MQLPRPLTLRTALVGGAIAAAAASAQPWHAADNRDEEAVALVTAMLINDAAIRTMSWEQVETVRRTPGEPDSPMIPFSRASVAFAPRAYALDLHMEWWKDPAVEGPTEWSDGIYRWDGEVWRTTTPEARHSGLIRPEHMDRRLVFTPLFLLGRDCDVWQVRLQGELLLNSPRLTVVREGAGDGVVAVEGFLQEPGHLIRVVVDIDTRRGFVPARIRRYHVAWNYLQEDFVTTRVEQFDGVWVPVEGQRTCFSLDWDRIRGPLLAAREAEGIPDRFDWSAPENLEAWHRTLARAFGPDGPPILPEGVGTCYLRVIGQPLVNTDLPAGAFELAYPDDAEVLNVFTGGPALLDPRGRTWVEPRDAARAGVVPTRFAGGRPLKEPN